LTLRRFNFILSLKTIVVPTNVSYIFQNIVSTHETKASNKNTGRSNV